MRTAPHRHGTVARRLAPRVRAHRLAEALAIIEARFGPGAVRRLAAHRPPARGAVSTGSLGLDLATGCGGLPRGLVTELLGGESSGKTALLYGAVASAQRGGGIAAIIDAEGAADGDALAGCGVDVDALVLAQPASVRDALLLLTILTRCGGLDLVALTSIVGLGDLLPPDSGADARGLDLARLLGRGLRVLVAALKDAPTAVVLTNRWDRRRPGYRSPGGLALHHFAALRLTVEARGPLLDEWGCVTGQRVRVTTVKNKAGRAGGRADLELVRGRGVDHPADLLAVGLAAGAIAPGPPGLLWAGDVLGRGEVAARRRLAADPALAAALERALRELAGNGRPAGREVA